MPHPAKREVHCTDAAVQDRKTWAKKNPARSACERGEVEANLD
jgi:hypothetical protein